MEILNFLLEYGGYIALPIVINALMQAGKKGFKKFFRSPWGIRVTYFLPIILGVLGGLLLPSETIQDKVLIGAALGALSHYIYKFVTVTLATKSKVLFIQGKKEEASLLKEISEANEVDSE